MSDSQCDSHIYSCHGGSVTCTCLSKLLEVLQKYFGFSSFRPGQMEAARSILHGQDVFVRMATGSGKSLCMFLGPLAKSDVAIGVIISPLNGLMQQQVNLLHDAGVTAISVGNESSAYNAVSVGDYRFVFMSPETAVRPPWRKIFQTPYFKKHLVLVAVDEAHCIPEWGCDFRTAFKSIGGLRAVTDVPFMALSASAPTSIAKAIEESLVLKTPIHITHSLDRPNIFLSLAKSKGLARDLASLVDMLSEEEEDAPKTLIFCRTKNDCAKVYSFLCKSTPRHSVSMYHSSLTQFTKSQVQADFKSGTELRCLSATIAFGMGMDIPDVDLVIIYGIPDTMSQLYQLCGRAGRVGRQSRAHLLLTSDTEKISDPTLKSYCTDKENCLRSSMISSLGGTIQHRSPCCMVCNPSEGGRLSLPIGKAPPRKKKRVSIRRVDEALITYITAQLKTERANYIKHHPTLEIIGVQLVCPDSVINSICSSVRFISVASDMDKFCLRQELKKLFFNTIIAAVT